jgi:hypothetical protein
VSGFERTIDDLEGSLLVSHVATAPLLVAHPAETVATVRAWANAAAINNVPVRRDGRIVAVVENLLGDLQPTPNNVPPRAPRDPDRVDAVARPLSGDMLIEGRHPLGGLIAELCQPPHYRLVVRGGELDSIVTPSDLGKLPMRVLAFSLITNLEATMTDAIRRAFASEEDAIAALAEGTQAQILGELARLHEKKLDPSLLEVTTLEQKGLILSAAGAFSGDPGTIAADFADLYQRLRNPLMHAASFVDDSLEALVRLSRQFEVVRSRTDEAAAFPKPRRF